MGRRRNSSHIWALWVAFGFSVVFHVIFFLEFARWLDDPNTVDTDPPQADSRPAEKLEVTMTREPPEPVETETPPDTPPEPRDEPEEKEKDENEDEKKKLERKYDRKAVVQETNEQQPEKADHVSSQANQVEKETRARETNEQFVPESDSSNDKQKRKGEKKPAEETKLGSKAVAARDQSPPKPPTPESTPPPKPRESEQTPQETEERTEPEREQTPKTAPDAPSPSPNEEKSAESSEQTREPLPMPSADDVSRLFDESKDREKVREHAEKGVGNDMFKRIEQNRGAVRSAMTNYISEIQPGNHTAVNAHKDVAASYINRIHSKIHPKWGGDFLPMLDMRYGPNSPFSDSSLNTVLELVVDGETGKLESVNIVDSSGLTTYDMQAIAIAKQVAPHPPAPSAIRSPDGNVYLHWNFWRDQRQCGTFGVSIYKLLEDGTKEEKGSRGMRE